MQKSKPKQLVDIFITLMFLLAFIPSVRAHAATTVTIKYNGNGTSYTDFKTYSVGKKRQALNGKITRKNYAFLGWDLNKNAEKPSYKPKNGVGDGWIEMIKKERKGFATLYAVWRPNPVTIVFNSNGGTKNTFKSTTYSYAMAGRSFIGDITRKGYYCAGWATTKNGKVSYSLHDKATKDFIKKNAGKTVTLYAVWKKNKTVTIKYNGNGFAYADAKKYSTGKKDQTLNGKITRKNYTFLGWDLNKNAEKPSYKPKNGVGDGWIEMIKKERKGSATLYAVWEPLTVTVNFNKNGGVGKFETQKFVYGKKGQSFTGFVTRTGYSFEGWAKNRTSAKADYPKMNYAVDSKYGFINEYAGRTVTLYAVWKPVAATVKFDANGGTGTFTQTLTYGKSGQKFEGKVAKSGFEFAGWASDKTGKDVVFNALNPVATNEYILKNAGKSVTLYAVWKDAVVDVIEANPSAQTNAQRAYGRGVNGFDIMYTCTTPDTVLLTGEQGDKLIGYIKDAGFTIAPVFSNYEAQWTYHDLDGTVKKLAGNNLKTYVYSALLTQDVAQTTAFNDTDPVPYVRKNEAFNVMMNNSNVLGIDLCDEPGIKCLNAPIKNGKYAFSDVANLIYDMTDGKKDVYINLFPNTANDAAITRKTGGDLARGNAYWNDGNRIDNLYYQQYICDYISTCRGVEYLSVDHYPELKPSLQKGFGITMANVRDMYYKQFVQMLTAIDAKNKTMRPMNVVTVENGAIDNSKKEQIMFQVNTGLAFGMKRLSYFPLLDNLLTDKRRNPEASLPVRITGYMINSDYATEAHYNYVKQINEWAFNIGNLLYPATIESVYMVEASGKTTKEYGDASASNVLAGATDYALVSAFKNGTSTYYMIANGRADKDITVTLKNTADRKYYNPCIGTGTWFDFPVHTTKVLDTGNTVLYTINNAKTITIPAGGAVVIE